MLLLCQRSPHQTNGGDCDKGYHSRSEVIPWQSGAQNVYFDDAIIFARASANPLPICAMIFAEPL